MYPTRPIDIRVTPDIRVREWHGKLIWSFDSIVSTWVPKRTIISRKELLVHLAKETSQARRRLAELEYLEIRLRVEAQQENASS